MLTWTKVLTFCRSIYEQENILFEEINANEDFLGKFPTFCRSIYEQENILFEEINSNGDFLGKFPWNQKIISNE